MKIKQIDREQVIETLVEIEYDTIELSEIRDILENGCRGYKEFSDEELVESFREWFDDDYLKEYIYIEVEGLDDE
tara:strand:+ start:198 stop:422 length:225 start_codon:yes stop_codon:yes gene_type:complete